MSLRMFRSYLFGRVVNAIEFKSIGFAVHMETLYPMTPCLGYVFTNQCK